MTGINFTEPQKLQIKDSIVRQLSQATIKNLPDAIVELVTNSDDSYRRLEQNNVKHTGEITISIERLKGGRLKKVSVIDSAEGIDRDQFEKALEFGGETSGFETGKTVRGLFGRGLKETVVVLGKGTIYSIKDNNMSVAELWWDKKEKSAKYRISESYTPSREDREKTEITGNGTRVEISDIETIKCPDLKTLKPQICNHFALRDINSSAKRKVYLHFESPDKQGFKGESIVLYETPTGKEIYNNEFITLPNYSDKIHIKIFESDSELESPYKNPYSKAGLLIKSGGAILDKELFRFSNEKAGCYFFGEVICEGIYEKIKGGDFGIIDPNRRGIEWEHQYSQVLRAEVEKILQPFIETKKEELSKSKPSARVSDETKKILNKICQLLNKFAKLELEKEPLNGTGLEEDMEVKEIMIKPQKANIELNKERGFSVYVPFKIGVIPKVKVTANNAENISVLDPTIDVRPHSKYPQILFGKFRIIGREIGATGIITCAFEESVATAEVNVVPEGKEGKKKEKLHIPKGGFFQEILPDAEREPAQRVAYEAGKIKIFVKFPMVQYYLNEKLEPKGVEGKAVLAELIGEAFCRFMAREKYDRGDYPIVQGAEPDVFTRAMNDVQKEYLHKIHGALIE